MPWGLQRNGDRPILGSSQSARCLFCRRMNGSESHHPPGKQDSCRGTSRGTSQEGGGSEGRRDACVGVMLRSQRGCDPRWLWGKEPAPPRGGG